MEKNLAASFSSGLPMASNCVPVLPPLGRKNKQKHFLFACVRCEKHARGN
jgi:hypothetical protein